jgi:hypothetical protein
MRLVETALIAAIGLLSAGCAHKSDSRPAALLPETGDVRGWTKTGQTRTFQADDLWKYIDGDADKYIRRGVERALTADYSNQDKIEATADIYVMGSAQGAREVFESEPSVDSRPVQIGDAGRLYRGSLTFRKGPYFVRLVAYQDAPNVGMALEDLGRAIESKLERHK